MKLFTIGDSISQGFMSLAAARTDLSFSSLIAKTMGIAGYSVPDWPGGGHPVNLELAFRRIEKLCGPNVNLLEWPLVMANIASLMDDVEDIYERGARAPDKPVAGNTEWFHNVAVRGYDVADAWLVTPALCRAQIAKESKFLFNDGFLALPSASFFRTALDVLNPSRNPKYDSWSALDWLKFHHDREGVENFILWLGSNNALGTIVDLKVKATNDPRLGYRTEMSHTERADFNLWSPEHFAEEYASLIDRVVAIMEPNRQRADWRVFVGTVPAVTIAPLAKGVGDELMMKDPFGVLGDNAKYYKYYTYVLFEEDVAAKTDMKLTRKEAYAIDTYIAGYNKSIRALVARANRKLGKDRFVIVDICEALLKAAYKRNDERPTYVFPEPVKARYPLVDTRFYHASISGELKQGGMFSLDGVHPSAIGQGMLAHEFLAAIDKARNSRLQQKLNWDFIYAADDLYMRPIRTMTWVRRQAELVKLYVNFMRLLGRTELSQV
ncbi:MAG: hypothetical protein KIT16_03110 [Rhodospirillaceae bacterium]|nr:hypothetical protein [Rhodospirillaceae bacterium]